MNWSCCRKSPKPGHNKTKSHEGQTGSDPGEERALGRQQIA
jgi:hypothetical protein